MMSERLTDRDYLLISAYLDSRLAPTEVASVVARLDSDPQFRTTLNEIAYTKRLLRSLPHKRAPRNFTLPRETAVASRRGWWLQPAFSFASVVSAIMLVVVFAGTSLFGQKFMASPKTAEPAAEMAVADQFAQEGSAPAIINWNPVLGMGGGDGTMIKEVYTGGGGIGGAGGPGFVISDPAVGGGTPAPEEVLAEALPPVEDLPLIEVQPAEALPAEAPLPTEIPFVTDEPPLIVEAPALMPTSEPQPEIQAESVPADSDLSTLILGVPAEEDRGEIIRQSQSMPAEPQKAIDLRVSLLAILGATTVLTGLVALLLRRR